MNILLIGDQGCIGIGLKKYLHKSFNFIGWSSKEDISLISTKMLKTKKINIVINLASIIDRSNKIISLNSRLYNVNILGVKTLVKCCIELNIPIIHISSKDIYGYVYKFDDLKINNKNYASPKFLIKADHAYKPETAYAKSKLISEYLIESYQKSTIIRLNTIYGDYVHSNQSWILTIIKKIINNEEIILDNNGFTFRDPLHISDFANLIKSIINNKFYGMKINVGGGKKNIICLNELYELVLKKTTEELNKKINIKFKKSLDFGFAFENNIPKKINWAPKKFIRNELVNLIHLMK
jgi:nucleoside-diphosphate-sugar epimerase